MDENGRCDASIVSIPAKRISFAEQAVKAYGTMVDSKISAAMKCEMGVFAIGLLFQSWINTCE